MDLIVNVPAGEDLVEPLGILAFAFLCNIGYTLGWLTEVSIKKSNTYGPKMFKVGLLVTLFLVFLPMVLHVIFWICRGFKTVY